jgi:predicted alpha/beta-fold hydrolase
MYMYACSVGAICATLYLLNDKETPIKAATFYGAPINPLKSSAFFEAQSYGFYNWIIGKTLRDRLSPMFKDLEKYSTPA